MRLLLMETSPVTVWLIRRLLPAEVELVHASEFEEAERVLREQPLDGAMFGLTPASVPWVRLRSLCERRVPPIPQLWYFSLSELPGGGDLSPEAAADPPRALVEELEERLGRFLARIEAARAGASGAPPHQEGRVRR